MTRITVAAALAGLALMTGRPAAAQDAAPQRQLNVVASDPGSLDDGVKLFRRDVRSVKKQIISANLELTDTEAEQFWPIYDRYTVEMSKVMDKKFALLKEYALNLSTITDEQADAYIKGRAEVEESVLQLRLKYLPVFRKVLSGKTAALFTQLDWRLSQVIDLQLASQVPLIEP
jgi:hypothetical protein